MKISLTFSDLSPDDPDTAVLEITSDTPFGPGQYEASATCLLVNHLMGTLAENPDIVMPDNTDWNGNGTLSIVLSVDRGE